MSDKTKNIIIGVLAVALAYSYFTRYSASDLEKAEDTAYDEGFDSGYAAGYEKGIEAGYDLGFDDGYDTLKPIPMPFNGAILAGEEPDWGSTIKVTASSQACVVSVKNQNDDVCVTFFVRPKQTVSMKVPKENLNVFFATGEEWYGFGEKFMFGDDTVYTKDRETLDFKNYTWEYTLKPVTNGNFNMSSSSKAEFF